MLGKAAGAITAIVLAISCAPGKVNLRPATPDEQLWAMAALTVNGSSLAACLQDRALDPRSGLLSTEFTIEPDGFVSDVRVLEDSIGSTTLRECSNRAYRSIRYPARHGSSAITVTHRMGVGVVELGRVAPRP